MRLRCRSSRFADVASVSTVPSPAAHAPAASVDRHVTRRDGRGASGETFAGTGTDRRRWVRIGARRRRHRGAPSLPIARDLVRMANVGRGRRGGGHASHRERACCSASAKVRGHRSSTRDLRDGFVRYLRGKPLGHPPVSWVGLAGDRQPRPAYRVAHRRVRARLARRLARSEAIRSRHVWRIRGRRTGRRRRCELARVGAMASPRVEPRHLARRSRRDARLVLSRRIAAG